MPRTLLPPDNLIDIPAEVAVCPICGSSLYCQLDEWSQRDDGTWGPGESVHVTCETEPEFEADDWEDWFDGHYAMPYVDWLPVDDIVTRSGGRGGDITYVA